MKQFLLITIACVFMAIGVNSQVAVSNDGSQPQSSAMLEVKSSDKGFLPPRMTRAEMIVIAAPANGLVVYCTDCNTTGALAMFMNNRWNTLTANCLVPTAPVAAIHAATASQVEWNWNPVADATGYRWNTWNSPAGAVDLGAVTTKVQPGLPCNTLTDCYVWAYNDCGQSSAVMLTTSTTANPPAPAAGTAVAAPTQITWNWNPVQGATGYKWSTSNVYANATDMGSATSKTETGLNCNQMYYRYVWAYNSCGNSSSKIMNQVTTTIPAAVVSGAHTATASSVTWTWGTVTGASGYKMNTVNNYATATDLGNITSWTESGLACSTTYVRYFWAYSPCANSIVTSASKKTAQSPLAPDATAHVPSVSQIVWNWTAVPGVTGYKWNTTNNYGTATVIGNVLTKTETGLVCNTGYTRYLWAYNSCGSSSARILTQTTAMSGIPAAPAAGTHTASTSQITWNWNAVPGATGYKWSTTNDYSTAVGMGTATTRTETGLDCATDYTRYVWAYTSCGVSPATTLTKTTVWCLWMCGMPITDSRDGKSYATVQIGTQCWFARNLNVGLKMYSNSQNQTNNGTITKYCMNELESNCTLYGGLYQWDELMNYTASSNTNPSGRQGICPTGWHIPSDTEWCEMEDFLDNTTSCSGEHLSGTDAGGQLKEDGIAHWAAPNEGATNSSGFTALPGGRINGMLVSGFLSASYMATSTENTNIDSWNHSLYADNQMVGHVLLEKSYGRSVRCVRD